MAKRAAKGQQDAGAPDRSEIAAGIQAAKKKAGNEKKKNFGATSMY